MLPIAIPRWITLWASPSTLARTIRVTTLLITTTAQFPGNVSDDQGNPLSGVTIELQAPDGTVIDTTTTDGSGNYIFADVEPGDYNVVETNPAGFPGNISDQDSTPDGDAADSDTTVDNVVGVTLNPGEDDTGNDFVDNNNGSIFGNVSDDQGNPLSGVTIELQSTRWYGD